MTLILDKACIGTRSFSCFHTTSSLSEKSISNENPADNLLSHCASAEGKTVPSRSQAQKL